MSPAGAMISAAAPALALGDTAGALAAALLARADRARLESSTARSVKALESGLRIEAALRQVADELLRESAPLPLEAAVDAASCPTPEPSP